jgi:hypothetical protein
MPENQIDCIAEDLLSWWVNGGNVPAKIHPSLKWWAHREFFGSPSYAAWAGVAVFLVSFGIVINNTTPGGEKKVGTLMLSLGFLFLVWASIVFFYANWPIQHRPAMISLLILVILLLGVIILAAVRLWVPFGSFSAAPLAVYRVPAPTACS